MHLFSCIKNPGAPTPKQRLGDKLKYILPALQVPVCLDFFWCLRLMLIWRVPIEIGGFQTVLAFWFSNCSGIPSKLVRSLTVRIIINIPVSRT